jgi:DNA-binding NtrC family response regulator
MTRPKILLVDDERSASESLTRGLITLQIEADFFTAHESERAQQIVKEYRPEVAIIDLSLNNSEGVESGYGLLKIIVSSAPETRAIILTGNSGLEFGVRALQEGAAHFIAKPADLTHLAALIRDCIFQSKLRSSLAQYREERELELTQGFIGESAQAQLLRREIHAAAQTSQAIFIRGETGTGKGLCAKLIHQMSARRQHPFVRYQPLFASSDLVNSDLFGHKKGAFTGASDNRSGLLQYVDKGSLFLDEIDELPHATQVMLLGVLQDKTFRCLGDNHERTASFRLISASNAAIENKIECGEFRRDLFHRIAHAEIHIPALRERRSDIPILAQYALNTISQKESLSPLQISASALNALTLHDWPGNVRELESTIEGAAWRALQRQTHEIDEQDLRFQGRSITSSAKNLSFHEQVNAFEKELLQKALRDNNQSISATARALGLDRGTVKRIIER